MNPGFRYRHWPGFSGRTNPYGLAATYVFIKQSGPPCHCDLRSQLFARIAGTPSPEVTGLICRVPSPAVSPTRLRLLTQATSVGSWYGLQPLAQSSFHCPLESRKPAIRQAIPPSHGFSSLRHSPALGELDRATALLPLSRGKRTERPLTGRAGGTGILTGFPFGPIPCGMVLRTGLLLADDALPRKPWPSGGRDSHPAMLLLPPGSALEATPQDLTALLLRGLYARLPHTSLQR